MTVSFQHGLFEKNALTGNVRAGISIGHKDTDNRFRDNDVLRNGAAGAVFRHETEAMGAHRNVFENNRFLDNGTKGEPGATLKPPVPLPNKTVTVLPF